MDDNEERKRLYDETASFVADAAMKGQISATEMSFLLSLLDQIMVKHQYSNMIDILSMWMKQTPNGEIDEIIKETLINIDFYDQKSVMSNLEIIKDLLGIREGKNNA